MVQARDAVAWADCAQLRHQQAWFGTENPGILSVVAINRNGALLSVMVLMCRVDGDVADAEIMRIRWIFEKLTGRQLERDDVMTVIGQVGADQTDLDPYLEMLGEKLSLDDRHMVLKAAFGIAVADGKVVDAEDAMMQKTARALQIDPQDYASIASHLMVAREFG